MTTASLTTAARVPSAPTDVPWQLGDFLPWPGLHAGPGRKEIFACIWRLPDTGPARVIQFTPYPASGGTCARHPDGGGCWRARLPLVSTELQLPSSRSVSDSLTPRETTSKGLLLLSDRCFRRSRARAAPRGDGIGLGQMLSSFVDAAASAMSERSDAASRAGDLWSPAAWQIYLDATTSVLEAREIPRECPARAGGGACDVSTWGSQLGLRVASSVGCRRALCTRYSFKVHECTWQLPHGPNTVGATLVGDLVGDFLVCGDFWPDALRVFQETENFVALERHLRDLTSRHVERVVRSHNLRHVLSEPEAMILHRALLAHVSKTPDRRTLKDWIRKWVSARVSPLVPHIAMAVCAGHAAVVNMDFSASDCRQLRAVGLRKKEKRTFAGVTGLGDVPLLPCLYVAKEQRDTVESTMFIVFRLLKLRGLRPIGLNVDNLAAWFDIITTSLDHSFPGLVKQATSESEAAFVDHLRGGGVVVLRAAKRVLGFELGQDALHVYMRMLESLNFRSQEVAWAIRCLRKWLGSVNPATRGGSEGPDDGGAAADKAMDDVEFAGANGVRSDAPRPASLEAALSAYFNFEACAPGTYEMLEAASSFEWGHPRHGRPLPPAAKAVILEDVARATTLKGTPRANIACAVYRVVYACQGHPSIDTIAEDLRGLQVLFQCQSFSPSGAVDCARGAGWAKAPPRGRRAPALVPAPPGGESFAATADAQLQPAVLNGLLASYRCKLWALHQGRDVSLGTVGTERLWRNGQRTARNKARARADADTVNLLTVIRWVNEVASRLLAAEDRRAAAAGPAAPPHRTRQLALSAEHLAASAVTDDAVLGHLRELFQAGRL
ncbi:unnamed protein product [Prorocentrum cordatum]|uniref:Uncharacterized protein n=1 Tax=Prorocentrum cordatum TaxID=2364126 RepID=A0ABN9S6V4_9DINO|nr:unnamed protein product [Polarella glacialis]